MNDDNEFNITEEEMEREILHELLDRILDAGDDVGVLQMAHFDDDMQIKIKKYRLHIMVKDEPQV